jgi:hypothetical protein
VARTHRPVPARRQRGHHTGTQSRCRRPRHRRSACRASTSGIPAGTRLGWTGDLDEYFTTGSARVLPSPETAFNFRHVPRLTATLERKGSQRVFHWTLGDIVWRPPSVAVCPSVTVRRVTNPHPVDAAFDRSARASTASPPSPRSAPTRDALIRRTPAVDIRATELGRCVLLPSERRSHLVTCDALISRHPGIGLVLRRRWHDRCGPAGHREGRRPSQLRAVFEGADIPAWTVWSCARCAAAFQSVGCIMQVMAARR